MLLPMPLIDVSSDQNPPCYGNNIEQIALRRRLSEAGTDEIERFKAANHNGDGVIVTLYQRLRMGFVNAQPEVSKHHNAVRRIL